MTRALSRWSCCVAAMSLCACNAVQSSLAPVGDQAAAIGRVWDLMLWICVPMYLLVLVAMAWALWRTRGGDRVAPGDRGIGKALAGFVVLVAGLLTVLTAASYVADRKLNAPAQDPLRVRITAKQWWWQVDYLSDDPSKQFTTANELHLPVDRPAHIELATTDVIHSLWIPVLAGKKDLIPGRSNVALITPRRTGRYRGQCAEFCGLQHAHMALDVQVDDAAAFAAWSAHQLAPAATPTGTRALAGQQEFASRPCALCHAIAGTEAGGKSGPDLTHLASRRTLAAGTLPLERTTLTSWIIDPQRYKPGTNMPAVPLTPQQREAIVDYLMELR